MRTIVEYRTTLAHKAIHGFPPKDNVEIFELRHPVLGPVPALRARGTIRVGSEARM
jgi:hypothetical protein